MNRFAFLLLLPLMGGSALLTAGCSNSPVGEFAAGGLMANRVSGWYETGQVVKSRTDLARTVRELLTRQGYQVPDFDAESEMIETAWDVHLSPRFREGTRTKIDVQILAMDRGGFNIRSRSWLEVNNEMQHPGNPDKASWVGAGVSEKHRDHIPEPAMRFHSMLRL